MARDETARESDSEASLLDRRSYLQLAGAAAASVAGLNAASATGAAAETQDDLVYETFNQTGYDDIFTDTWQQGTYDGRVSDPSKSGSHALEVEIPQGNHYGVAATYDPVEAGDIDSEATELYANTWVRFSSNYDGKSGKLPGPANTEPGGGKGGEPSTGTNGWSARGAFDASVSGGVRVGYYCYHMDQGGTYGDHFWGTTVPTGQWVKLSQYIKLNSVDGGSANADGQLKMWIDDELLVDKSGMRFTEDLSIGCNYSFNVYYGGSWTSPQDQSVFFDRFAISDTQMPDISGSGTSGSGDQTQGKPLELVAGSDTSNVQYEFTVEGTVTKNTTAGDNAAESNDSITDNGDGTVTVTGTSGNGYGDSYYVDGSFTSMSLDESKWTIRYDGTEVSVQELLPSAAPSVERFDVSTSNKLGGDRMFSVKWAAADADGDLDTVEAVVNDGSTDVNFAVNDVSGSSASGWELFQFPAGTTMDVTLRVKDAAGSVTKRTQSVSL
ncbi:polysaccharide lyase [Halorussus aquaticus]|uniref:Polysaccharide lyase n=1 Tax=Halorussus aquaticus TaxID=2953748 RepID=A0ABD5Q0U0_9EURY|nr:polysaccharide lyase [Halorussus aquaticus]